MNEKNEVKKVTVGYEDSELSMINLPFTTLIGSLSAGEIKDIEKVSADNYSANLQLSSENADLNALCTVLGKMDTSIDLKGIAVTNPVNGIGFTFTMKDGKITDYTLTAAVSVPVKGVSVSFDLTYEQHANKTPVTIPSLAGIVTDSSEISRELAAIATALTGVEDDSAYSLDLEAVNEFDPGWTVLGTEDSYKARLYKNTTSDGTVDFNHSYEYQSHHETQGRETYSFTIGNTTEDGGTYLRSRKGSDTTEKIENVTAETQFDLLTGLLLRTASEFDCLKKTVSGTKTTYEFYFKDAVAAGIPEEVVALLDTNDAEGVLDVENYFDEGNYTVKDATLVVVMDGGEVKSMKIDTEIRYAPVGGEYTENTVTLNDSVTLTVNDKLDKAQGYKAPKKAGGLIGGLENIL